MNRFRVAWIYRPYRHRIWCLNILSVLQAVDQVAIALVSRYVIDSAIYRKEQLLFWGILLVAVLLLLVLLHAVYSWLAGSTVDKCTAKMRHDMVRAAACCKAEQMHRYHSGTLLSRGMEDVKTVCNGMANVLPHMIGQLARLGGALAVVIFLYPGLSPVLIAAGAVVGIASAVFRPVMRKQHNRVRKTEETVMAEFQEDLGHLELIKSLQMEENVLTRFERKLKVSLSAQHKRRRVSVSVQSMISLLSQLGTGALLLWGAVQVAKGDISYGSLTAMIQLLAIFRSPVLGLSGLWTQLTAVEVADNRLRELLDNSQPTQVKTLPEDIRVEKVIFENVTFGYPDDVQPALEDFTAELNLGRWTCLTGASGKGKSTIFRLILGIYEPQQGRVYLRTNHGDIPCGEATRELFAYVPQDYALFSGTVMENLLLAKADATQEERERALQIACCDFILDAPEGEMTEVLENNSGLSKGQIQRLAIARAVLMQRPIFLLDECTSALDAATEGRVLEQIAGLGKQAIVVTHRPEVLQNRTDVTFSDI